MIQASFRLVAPEKKRQEFLSVLLCLKGPTEALVECQACRILQDAKDKNILTYLVTWQTQNDLEEHFRSDRFQRLLPYIDMSVEPPEIEISHIDRIGGIEFLVAALNSASDS